MIAIIEMFATKGTEYLLILAYLALLIPFWMLLRDPDSRARRALRAAVDWFSLPADVAFHPGHSWARRSDGDRVRIGVDDLAQSFVGRPDRVEVPEVGARLTRGQPAWTLTSAGHRMPMVAPMDGEVVAVNQAVLDDPSKLTDPYGDGWLLELRVRSQRRAFKGLMTGDSARAWMAATVDAVRARMGGELGPVMQDGGTPAAGFGRYLGEDWPAFAGALFETTLEPVPPRGGHDVAGPEPEP